jgi:hypothetical protein
MVPAVPRQVWESALNLIMRELRATRVMQSVLAKPPMALNGTLLTTSAGVGEQIYFLKIASCCSGSSLEALSGT